MFSSLDISKEIHSRHDGIKRLILKNQDRLGKVKIVETGCKKEIFLNRDQYEKLLLIFRDSKKVWRLRMKMWRELHFSRKKIKKLKSNTGE